MLVARPISVGGSFERSHGAAYVLRQLTPTNAEMKAKDTSLRFYQRQVINSAPARQSGLGSYNYVNSFKFIDTMVSSNTDRHVYRLESIQNVQTLYTRKSF